MELLTDDIPDFMTPTAPQEEATPDKPAGAKEPDGVDLTTLQGLITLEVAAQMQALPREFTDEGRITARSPQGFIITLVVRKNTAGEVLTALTSMEKWCVGSGFTPIT